MASRLPSWRRRLPLPWSPCWAAVAPRRNTAEPWLVEGSDPGSRELRAYDAADRLVVCRVGQLRRHALFDGGWGVPLGHRLHRVRRAGHGGRDPR